MDNIENMTDEQKLLALLREHWGLKIEGLGGYCPVCDRWGKIYPRSLNSAMARGLLWLVKQQPRSDGWIEVAEIAPRWMLRTPQFASLKYWGLVATMPVDKGSKVKSSGLWQVTDKGRAFAHQQLTVHKYVHVYNDTALGLDGDQVYITDCLGDKYDYQQIMGGYFYDDTGSESEEEGQGDA